ncbi:MAG: acyclic terpene utilization AtuA family protein [Aeromicrobium sp.]
MDDTVRIMTPSGMLGSGWPEATIERGLALGVDVITVDGGSTDSGPHYLGSGTPKTAAAAVARDLRSLLGAAVRADVPLVIGSCGTSGTDSGVDWVGDMVDQIMAEEGMALKVARIYSEQTSVDLKEALNAGRIHPLPPLGELRAETLESCTHIVGMMGAEPIIEALRAGAQVVLAGRATDAGVAAAYALLKGMPAGPSWHAGKIAECGGQATANPRTGGVYITVDAEGFTIEALDADTACTVQTVAAHMLYETVNPYEMREPAGTLDVRDATYVALDERRVRVEGSRFHEAEQHTIKLEGARITGYETMLFAGVRDPLILADIEGWAAALDEYVRSSVIGTLGLRDDDFAIDVRLYGHNAVLGDLEIDRTPPREVGVMLLVNAADQATATAIAKIANPPLLHFPAAGMDYFPSTAFATSPAHVERGAAYEFVLNHVVDADPTSMFRTEYGD